MLSGIIFVNRNGLRWRDTTQEHRPTKTLYNRWKRWSDKGVFIAMMDNLSAKGHRAQNDHNRRPNLKANRIELGKKGKEEAGAA